MASKNRSELKSFFVKNAIPTEANFKALIDSQLNQADDGVFKLPNEPLSVVAASGEQKRALRLYADYPASQPDWLISLASTQTSGGATKSRPGLGVTDGAGNTRLFIEAGTGNVGIGTTNPRAALHVRGDAVISGRVSDEAGAVMPVGGIIMWSGRVEDIPDGWALCDGSNGTPDLRGRFVLGANKARAPGAKGGAETHKLTTAEMPKHKHSISGGAHKHLLHLVDPKKNQDYSFVTMYNTNPRGTKNWWSYDTGDKGSTHNHNCSDTGASKAHNNMPPFYALAYIMKL